MGSLGEEDIYNSFKNFYSLGSSSIDLLNQKATEDFRTWEKKDWVKLAKDNPLKFLAKTHGDFFVIDGVVFCLNRGLEEFKGNEAFTRNSKYLYIGCLIKLQVYS
jgi:hypothetical protein